MSITNTYGHFTDTPVEKRWVFSFKVLSLPRDHRRILNRQPEVHLMQAPNGAIVVFMPLNKQVMSN
jgi:hypothetical protein